MDSEILCQNANLEAVSLMQTELKDDQDVEPIMESIEDDNSKQSNPEPARGLELIFQVASELATRIAEEKRYEGIIKPCSIDIQRITDVANYNIVNDANRILDETQTVPDDKIPPDEQPSPVNAPPVQTETSNMHIDLTDSDDDEEMIIPSEEELDDCEIIQDNTASYFCIFCDQKNIQGKNKAVEHYQAHLDYYPYKCLVCLEVLTNLQNLINHFRKEHEDVKTAMFKKKLMPWVSEWIDIFLNSQAGAKRNRNLKILAYCPVCESSEKKEDIIQIPPNLIAPKKQITHIFKHLLYQPYVCSICHEAGKKFSVSEFDDRAYEHILKVHPEAEDILLSQVYRKLKCIKPLEAYIFHYLTNVGVSTKRRFPEKIPNFVRNKFKAKIDREKSNADKDNNKTVTLGDLVNQDPSASLQSNHSNLSFNGQVILKMDNITVSNQIRPNTPNFQSKPISKTPIMVNRNATINPAEKLYSPLKQSTAIKLPCRQLMVRPPITPSNMNNSRSIPVLNNILMRPTIISPQINSQCQINSQRPQIHQQTQNSSPTTVQVVPDVETLLENPMLKPKTGDFVKGKYLCIFCKTSVNFDSYTDALFHFSSHLNYNPVSCLLCYKKFQDLNSIIEHFNVNHSHETLCQNGEPCSPLLYYINQEAETERWIEENLHYQLVGEMIRIIDPDLAPFCPVCRSILNNIPPREKSDLPPIEAIRAHLNQHLNYKPYECFLCSCVVPRLPIRFHAIGEAALMHLRDVHGCRLSTMDLREFFSFKPIPGLENFIKNFIISDYYSISNKLEVSRNVPSTAQNISTQNASTSNNIQLNGKNHNGTVPKRLFNIHTYSKGSSPSVSVFSSPSPKNNASTTTTLACYHCKLLISGPRELYSHSKSIHPNQSVAAYGLPNTNGY